MKLMLLIATCLILFLVGCSQAPPVESGSVTQVPIVAVAPESAPSPVIVVPDEEKGEVVVIPDEPPITIRSSGAISAIPANYVLSEKGAVGFEPGKYTIENLSPGRSADLLIVLHSDRKTPITFALSYRIPSYTVDGYDTAPFEADGWLLFETDTPTLEACEKKGIKATITVPEDASVPDKWEFWIAIKEAGQTSQVQTEGCMRVFVKS